MNAAQHILVYSDSLMWGIVPGTRRRLPFDSRWPGVMHNGLNVGGARIRVTEDCLNGRRTVFDDPYKPGRNALAGIQNVIEAQSPLDFVILMLGTNDFQLMQSHTPWHSATGLAAVVNAVRTAPIEPGMSVPPILLVAPPQIDDPRAPLARNSRGEIPLRAVSQRQSGRLVRTQGVRSSTRTPLRLAALSMEFTSMLTSTRSWAVRSHS